MLTRRSGRPWRAQRSICHCAAALGGRPERVQEGPIRGPQVVAVDAQDEQRGAVALGLRDGGAEDIEPAVGPAQVGLGAAVGVQIRGVGRDRAAAERGEEPLVGQASVEVDVDRVHLGAGEGLPLPPAAVPGPEARLGDRADAVDHRVLQPLRERVAEAELLPVADALPALGQAAERGLGDVGRVAVEGGVVVADDLVAEGFVGEVPGQRERVQGRGPRSEGRAEGDGAVCAVGRAGRVAGRSC